MLIDLSNECLCCIKLHNNMRSMEEAMEKTENNLFHNVSDNFDVLFNIISKYIKGWNEDYQGKFELYLSVGDYRNAEYHPIIKLNDNQHYDNLGNVRVDIHG